MVYNDVLLIGSNQITDIIACSYIHMHTYICTNTCIQGRRKRFYIGQAKSLDTFECMEKVATLGLRHTGCLYCTKHNQHAKYANARGSGKNLKSRYSEIKLILVAFKDLTIDESYFN